ncbi:MAG: hypothetical protein IPK58_05740 [Acidobacteria bacterium]|nr:hypothetical protein [Acidobacteriota bacterium]
MSTGRQEMPDDKSVPFKSICVLRFRKPLRKREAGVSKLPNIESGISGSLNSGIRISGGRLPIHFRLGNR